MHAVFVSFAGLGCRDGPTGAPTEMRSEEHLSAPTDARCDVSDLRGECVLSSVLPALVHSMQLVHTLRPSEGNEDVSVGMLADGCAGDL